MMALALRETHRPSRERFFWQRPGPVYRSTHTWTSLSVEEPPLSEAANTTEADSQRDKISRWLGVANRLNQLLQLQDGWGGPGSLRVDRDVVRKTIEILVRIADEKTRPPSISPGQDGSLQLAWYGRELELEIDVPRSGDPTALLYHRDTGRELELALTSPELDAAIERVAAG